MVIRKREIKTFNIKKREETHKKLTASLMFASHFSTTKSLINLNNYLNFDIKHTLYFMQ